MFRDMARQAHGIVQRGALCSLPKTSFLVQVDRDQLELEAPLSWHVSLFQKECF